VVHLPSATGTFTEQAQAETKVDGNDTLTLSVVQVMHDKAIRRHFGHEPHKSRVTHTVEVSRPIVEAYVVARDVDQMYLQGESVGIPCSTSTGITSLAGRIGEGPAVAISGARSRESEKIAFA